MGRSVDEVGGAVLLVSQFTLYGDLRRGRRPSFDDAMPPEDAERAYDAAVREVRATGVRVETGRFRADMQVHAVNDGPVTIWLDSATRSLPRSG
jgi:D-aminoacyl-tRNA deacylase